MISKLLKSSVWVLSCSVFENVMHCVIWYHLYSLNMNNTNGGNLKVTLLHGFFTFFKLYKWYQIAQRITCSFRASGKIVPAKSQLSSPTEYLLAFWELSGSIGKNTESTCFQVVLVRKLIMVSSKFLLPYHLYPILPHVGFRHHQHP